MSLLNAKRKAIHAALVRFGGNKTQAAAHLEMSIRSLRDLTNTDPYFSEFRGDKEYRPTPPPHQEKAPMPLPQPAPQTQLQPEMSQVFDTKEVVTTLNNLMNRVTEKECTSDTVNAACNCAHQITQLLKVHLDVERLKRSYGR
jgi:hypothetical protein